MKLSHLSIRRRVRRIEDKSMEMNHPEITAVMRVVVVHIENWTLNHSH
jgi:hypothetical protein